MGGERRLSTHYLQEVQFLSFSISFSHAMKNMRHEFKRSKSFLFDALEDVVRNVQLFQYKIIYI